MQIRLTAPIFKTHTTCTAGASSRSLVSKTSPARDSTETPCHFINCGVAKWEGRGLIRRYERVRFPPPLFTFHGLGASAQGCLANNLCSERYRVGPPFS